MSTRSLAGDTTPARPVDDFAAGATYLSDIDGGSDFVLVDGVLETS